MSAKEIKIPSDKLDKEIKDLEEACCEFNLARISKKLMSLPIEFNPSGEPSDIIWKQNHAKLVNLDIEANRNIIDINQGKLND